MTPFVLVMAVLALGLRLPLAAGWAGVVAVLALAALLAVVTMVTQGLLEQAVILACLFCVATAIVNVPIGGPKPRASR